LPLICCWDMPLPSSWMIIDNRLFSNSNVMLTCWAWACLMILLQISLNDYPLNSLSAWYYSIRLPIHHEYQAGGARDWHHSRKKYHI
jgi:hypothetical protein